jgi:single-strand DNA-binding protein
MNKVLLVGRITKDPELRATTSGQENVNFSVAVNRQFKSQTGERQADFINCVAWNQPARFIANYVKKGHLIAVEGRIQTRQYEAAEGMRYVTEVVVENVNSLQARDENQPSSYQAPTKSVNQSDSDEYYESSKALSDTTDDLPF